MANLFSVLRITDGYSTVDLLGGNKGGNGFLLDSYTVGRPALKGGGAWQDSPFANGRHLVHGNRANPIDNLTLKAAYPDHGSLIASMQVFDSLLDKAQAYWLVDWQDEPVWLEATVHGETGLRYALIYGYEFSNYPNPYSEPYVNDNSRKYVLDGLVVSLERSFWQNNQPGTSERIAITGSGYDTALQAGLLIGNRNAGALTGIHKAPAGTINTTNLLSGSPPYSLFAASDTTNSAIYFGANDPFGSLIFNLNEGVSGSQVMVYEYYNGTTWVDLAAYFSIANIPDSTAGLFVSGVHSVRWLSPADWVKNQPVGGLTTSYWMRARISSGTVGGTPPSQQTRHVCTANQAYVDIDETQIAGDLNALSVIRFISEGATEDTSTEVGPGPILRIGQIMFGLRNYERGPNFNAYINMATADNVAGIAVNVAPYRNPIPVITTTAASPAGSTLTWSNSSGDTEMADLFTVVLDGTIAQEFYGEYRLLMRMKHDGQQGETTVRYAINFNTYLSATKTGKTKLIAEGVGMQVVDLGGLKIPHSNDIKMTDTLDAIALTIQLKTANARNITIYDLILLPTDQMAGEISGTGSIPLDETYYIESDAINYPGKAKRCFLKNSTSGNIIGSLDAVLNGEQVLHASTRQRLWVTAVNGADQDDYNLVYGVEVEKMQRYHFLRSD